LIFNYRGQFLTLDLAVLEARFKVKNRPQRGKVKN